MSMDIPHTFHQRDAWEQSSESTCMGVGVPGTPCVQGPIERVKARLQMVD